MHPPRHQFFKPTIRKNDPFRQLKQDLNLNKSVLRNHWGYISPRTAEATRMATQVRITKSGKENRLRDRFEEVHGRRIVRDCRESGVEEETGEVKMKEGGEELQNSGWQASTQCSLTTRTNVLQQMRWRIRPVKVRRVRGRSQRSRHPMHPRFLRDDLVPRAITWTRRPVSTWRISMNRLSKSRMYVGARPCAPQFLPTRLCPCDDLGLQVCRRVDPSSVGCIKTFRSQTLHNQQRTVITEQELVFVRPEHTHGPV